MIRFFLSLLALFLPWLVLLLLDNPGGAVLALIMQGSLIGWPFATVWAWKSIRAKKHKPTRKEKE